MRTQRLGHFERQLGVRNIPNERQIGVDDYSSAVLRDGAPQRHPGFLCFRDLNCGAMIILLQHVHEPLIARWMSEYHSGATLVADSGQNLPPDQVADLLSEVCAVGIEKLGNHAFDGHILQSFRWRRLPRFKGPDGLARERRAADQYQNTDLQQLLHGAAPRLTRSNSSFSLAALRASLAPRLARSAMRYRFMRWSAAVFCVGGSDSAPFKSRMAIAITVARPHSLPIF